MGALHAAPVGDRGGIATAARTFTLLQERIPAEARGRAFAAISGMILAGAPIGMRIARIAGITFDVVGLLIAIRREFANLGPNPPARASSIPAST